MLLDRPIDRSTKGAHPDLPEAECFCCNKDQYPDVLMQCCGNVVHDGCLCTWIRKIAPECPWCEDELVRTARLRGPERSERLVLREIPVAHLYSDTESELDDEEPFESPAPHFPVQPQSSTEQANFVIYEDSPRDAENTPPAALPRRESLVTYAQDPDSRTPRQALVRRALILGFTSVLVACILFFSPIPTTHRYVLGNNYAMLLLTVCIENFTTGRFGLFSCLAVHTLVLMLLFCLCPHILGCILGQSYSLLIMTVWMWECSFKGVLSWVWYG
ncbi:hypothetical protein EJ07DRAFT_160062 [Lizonia empirigonia]|nr:hypothetical protein EJ07DRAFT_160062 [Lizonia empirigonia]